MLYISILYTYYFSSQSIIQFVRRMTLTKSTDLIPVVKKISFQLAKNVAAVNVGSSKFHRSITFNNVDWLEIYFSPGSAKFSEDKKLVEAGIEYHQKLTFRFPGEISEKYTDIENIEILEVIVKIEFSSGVVKLMGTTSVPSLFDSDFKSNTSSTGSDFEFTCISANHVYLLD